MLENLNIDPETLMMLPVILFALSVHEAAHALAADRGGDDTARLQGRITLNPISHIDPIGTILVPLVLIMSGMPAFGWAKPVPVQPHRLKNGHWFAFVAAAGPLSNLIIAAVALLAMFIGTFFAPYGDWPEVVQVLGFYTVMINIVLMIFNLWPIPPLDGSKIFFQYVVSGRVHLYKYWEMVEQMGFMLVFILLMIPGVRYLLFLIQSVTAQFIQYVVTRGGA